MAYRIFLREATRIAGLKPEENSFPEADQSFFVEEAKRRDHRRLGKELELFTTQDQIGPGLILWLPKGALLRRLIEDYWKDEHYRHDYERFYSH